MIRHRRARFLLAGLAIGWLSNAPAAVAADWPTFGGDNRRSGVTEEKLRLPLRQAWTHRAVAPRPAWPAPAKQDFWHKQYRITPSITFDRALHVAVAHGRVFFGCSAADKVVCLDAATGRQRWSFFAEGPVRLAPSIADGKVYFGSDDGHAYCLTAGDGKLLWKRRIGPQDRRVPGNGRMISLWPVRCGPVVDAGTVWLCAGLFPNYGVYLCALDAADGAERWKRRLDAISPQGYMLASQTRLFVPCGRTAPAVFDRSDGRPLGALLGNGRGGTYALVVDELVVHRGEAEGSLTVSDNRTRERIVSFDGRHMAVRRGTAYLHSERELAALDRMKYVDLARKRNLVTARRGALEKQIKETGKRADPVKLKELEAQLAATVEEVRQLDRVMQTCWIWKRPCTYPHALILAGDLLFAGGDNEVAAIRTHDGATAWKAAVTGKAYGLAIAAGRLYVSTGEGTIHCFQSMEPAMAQDCLTPGRSGTMFLKGVSLDY